MNGSRPLGTVAAAPEVLPQTRRGRPAGGHAAGLFPVPGEGVLARRGDLILLCSLDDSQAADDFTVPANTKWTVKGVAVQGLYFNGPGPAQSFNVRLYQDGGGEPGTLRLTRLNQTYTLNGTDEFRIKLNPAANIPASPNPRHVWIEVQANLDFA